MNVLIKFLYNLNPNLKWENEDISNISKLKSKVWRLSGVDSIDEMKYYNLIVQLLSPRLIDLRTKGLNIVYNINDISERLEVDVKYYLKIIQEYCNLSGIEYKVKDKLDKNMINIDLCWFNLSSIIKCDIIRFPYFNLTSDNFEYKDYVKYLL